MFIRFCFLSLPFCLDSLGFPDVKMFKDIGVSVHRLWYKSVCSLLSSLCLDLVCLSHLCVGLNPERSSFCRINHAGISGDWEEEGHVEGEAPLHRFI